MNPTDFLADLKAILRKVIPWLQELRAARLFFKDAELVQLWTEAKALYDALVAEEG